MHNIYFVLLGSGSHAHIFPQLLVKWNEAKSRTCKIRGGNMKISECAISIRFGKICISVLCGVLWFCVGQSSYGQNPAGSADGEKIGYEFVNLDRFPTVVMGPLNLGGSIRGGMSWEEGEAVDGYINTFGLRMDLDLGRWQGSAAYRYVTNEAPSGSESDFHALHHAWVAYDDIGERGEIKVGVQQVPFGLLPYASDGWFFSLARYAGLEDDRDLGVVWNWEASGWRLNLGFFPGDEGDWSGGSSDAARLSFDSVEHNGFGAKEKEQVNVRCVYRFEHEGEGNFTEVGASGQYMQLDPARRSSREDGYAAGVHVDGNYGGFNTNLQLIRYEYDRISPLPDEDSVVLIGGYDVSGGYNLARRGWLQTLGVSYKFDVPWGGVDTLKVYNDFGLLVKDREHFHSSAQNVTGVGILTGRVYTYLEVITARNHPWLADSPGTRQDALGEGADADWRTLFHANVGFYF